jgi:IMP dehydrogenase
MDTVTEETMAITIARLGGIGVIHRFTSIEKQAEMVRRVKRAENITIDKPYSISPDATLEEARKLTERYGVTGFMVVKDGKLVGILSRRDMLFQPDDKKVRDVMTPKEKLITARPGISLEEAKKILWGNRVEKLPLVDEDGNLRGLITAADIVKKMKYPNAARDRKGRLLVAAAIGIRGDYKDRIAALIDAGVDALVIDVANGYIDRVVDVIREVKREYPDIDVVAGNIATEEGAEKLAEAGADALRVGIGPGSVCTTRIVAGVGVPQLTAIIDTAKVAKKYDIPIIADGGIRKPGDVVKALGAGAECVMIGRLFAGTDESPGKIVLRNGRRFKIYRGMASFYARLAKDYRERGELDISDEIEEYAFTTEGVEAYVEYTGSVEEVVNRLISGLRAGMAYIGARTIKEMPQKAKFIRITNAGLKESYPHDVYQF